MSSPVALKTRLFLASALLLPVFLGLTGLALEQAFQRSLTYAAEQRLQSHVYLLFSVAELSGAGAQANLVMPLTLAEPDFERVNSGLYGYISHADGRVLWRSGSAELLPEPSASLELPEQPGQLYLDEIEATDRPHWRARYGVIWEDDAGAEHRFLVTLLKNQDSYRAELAGYRSQLWRWLGAAAIILLLAQSGILRWGLRPLNTLAWALDAMRRGETRHIAGNHPRELQPIVDNLNQVLSREQALRLRYRNSLSTLAHSLKTPLAVLRGHIETGTSEGVDLEDSEIRQTILEQVARMDQVVSYQLRQAVSDQQGLRQSTPLKPALGRLKRTLDKAYYEKGIGAALLVEDGLMFPGDEQDLLEALGHLLDNAYKYGRRQVQVVATQIPGTLYLKIDDDGPGIPKDQRESVLQRDQRLDSLQPGQGIGLAVAADIVQSYGGHLKVSGSDLGGTRIELRLPA